MLTKRPRKKRRRRKVRRMSNLATHVEVYIYVILGFIILVNILITIYGR